MTKEEMFEVLEALKAGLTELEALIDDDVHFPSGRLMEQIESAIKLVETRYAE